MAHCMKEIRARKGFVRWIGCKRKASVSVPSKHVPGMTLDYCKKHAPK